MKRVNGSFFSEREWKTCREEKEEGRRRKKQEVLNESEKGLGE